MHLADLCEVCPEVRPKVGHTEQVRPADALVPGGPEREPEVWSVQIWPRTDACCLDRLTNFNVFVSDEAPGTDDPFEVQARPGVASFYVFGTPGVPTTIAVKGSGRYVRIQMAHPSLLDLAELQVWSDPSAPASGP